MVPRDKGCSGKALPAYPSRATELNPQPPQAPSWSAWAFCPGTIWGLIQPNSVDQPASREGSNAIQLAYLFFGNY